MKMPYYCLKVENGKTGEIHYNVFSPEEEVVTSFQPHQAD